MLEGGQNVRTNTLHQAKNKSVEHEVAPAQIETFPNGMKQKGDGVKEQE